MRGSLVSRTHPGSSRPPRRISIHSSSASPEAPAPTAEYASQAIVRDRLTQAALRTLPREALLTLHPKREDDWKFSMRAFRSTGDTIVQWKHPVDCTPDRQPDRPVN